ncbi:YIP1 family protein [Natrononativus amylolyticus]|uniref:YIP1 family protein n=1 Tax=Natrononativus amylolyticus TaxID=2963434 RepID=UPI0020CD5502|nr:YIP1 family protein [Natrononativus amylolyticus]
MTRWIENPEGGRDRGPRALARAWVEVLVRPWRFFRAAVSPGDQAPGLTFLMTVVLVSETTRFLLVPGVYSLEGVSRPIAGLFWLSLVVLLVAPLALHLVSALQTLVLMVVVEDRAGISQTVQVIAYSTAPCALAGIPVPELRALLACYGAVLLIVGLRIVHDTSLLRATVAGAVPAALVFGYGFRGFDALGNTVLLQPIV